MIEVINLHKGFNGEAILKGITTTFDRGKTNLIIGTSGSGKTVFLKCLLGLFTPEEGTICYDGSTYSDLNEQQQRDLREQMGMVFQGSALFDSMTVEENVMFPLMMFTKQKKEEMTERVHEVLNRVNLENAKYLFCDEPNSGLDPRTAIVIDNLIKEITEEYDITTVINTHDMNSVMEIGEKIVFLKNGYLEWEGDKTQIFKTDNKAVTDFVYSSNLFKKVRDAQLKGL